MKKTNFYVFACIIGLTVIISFISLAFEGRQELENWQELEHYLQTARIISAIPDEDAGRSEPWRITLDDGTQVRKGWFKHLNRARPHILPDSYKYELAAYELDKLLGLNVVPPVVEREIKGYMGSLQLFVEGCRSLSELKRKKDKMLDSEEIKSALQDIMVFEILTFCLRDSEGEKDVLIHEDSCKVCRVDFSQAFSLKSHLLPGIEDIHCTAKLKQNLVNLPNNKIASALMPYLNTDEIEALLARKKLLEAKLQH